jgi:RNA polymerase sigma-70 factor (ECF subfamily)
MAQSMAWFELPFLQKSTRLVEPGQFARFFEEQHLAVFRYVMVLCGGNQAEAEDITASAFFRAWEKRTQFNGSPSAALGWVIAIARNLLIDQRRAEASRGLPIGLDDELPTGETTIEEVLMAEEQLDQALAALGHLPFHQREAFVLRYVLGWRVKDIAAQLGLAENTVSTNLRRALAKIQRQLAQPEMSPENTEEMG